MALGSVQACLVEGLAPVARGKYRGAGAGDCGLCHMEESVLKRQVPSTPEWP